MNMNEGRRDRATTGEREFFPFFFFMFLFLFYLTLQHEREG